ncbi:hypothetical protein B0H14DRAFT_3568761 [Mycena olivaceomarginata]|nr:hypothetical protein B0H14DRAFT_3568761 [Mycena olivaceomarginata]
MSNFSNRSILVTDEESRAKSTHRDPSTFPDDERDDNPGSTPIPGLNLAHPRSATQNAVNAVQVFCQETEVSRRAIDSGDTFLNDTPTVREGKIFSLLLGLQNDVGNIIVAAPAFSVSAELQTNIKSYALAVMLSPKLAQYRGDLPVQHVINNPADMQKITAAVQYAFTQDRSSLKKKLFASVRVSQLNEAGAFVDGTKCRITNALCGRIALMRDIYLQNSTSSFWSSLDAALSLMRTAADGNEQACDAMFEDLIIADKALHWRGGHCDARILALWIHLSILPPSRRRMEPPGNGEEPQEQGPGQGIQQRQVPWKFGARSQPKDMVPALASSNTCIV